ncbi:hypothetical protein BKA70DRAFT_1208880 [Coprinopsis sp. MPI-PUGE-AT-0042]|nr:hypothetical protein BKA70DRAFT_1208880 [Coprinopsis sp. MPI-PUGE-AT-0042]
MVRRLSNVIKFQPDGTGEIFRRAELSLHLAVHFTWRVLAGGSEAAPAGSTVIDQLSQMFLPTSRTVAMAQIEITLSTRTDRMSLIDCPPGGWNSMIGGGLLPQAFQPRVFSLKFERGEIFPSQHYTMETKYTLRMTCDSGPFPKIEDFEADRRECVRNGISSVEDILVYAFRRRK